MILKGIDEKISTFSMSTGRKYKEINSLSACQNMPLLKTQFHAAWLLIFFLLFYVFSHFAYFNGKK